MLQNDFDISPDEETIFTIHAELDKTTAVALEESHMCFFFSITFKKPLPHHPRPV